jgi:hypothetical protein
MRCFLASRLCIFAICFWAVALGFSVFYGVCCWTIHELDLEPELADLTERWKRPWKKLWKDGTWAWKVHQGFLNFCGSMFGWGALWYLLRDYLSRCLRPLDFALAVIAFLGITGLLPRASRYGSPLYGK